MTTRRKGFSATLKAKIAIEALRGQKTVRDLAAQHKVHSTQIHTWKKRLLDGAADLFERGHASSREQEFKQRETELFEEIGRLKMELEWLKKSLPSSVEGRKALIESSHTELSIRRQCELVGLSRSSYYSEPASETEENLHLMRIIDKQHLDYPHMGRLSMTQWLNLQGHQVNIKRVRRLMNLMDLTTIYQRPNTSLRNKQHQVFPYLLRGVPIVRVNQVWSTDITYIPMQKGFMYLAAVIDWHSRHVLSWRLSNTLDGSFCIEALEEAFASATQLPEIFNTDQGAQFTSSAFTSKLKEKEIQISMDGKGRALDNVFIERLWRSLKYENIYLKYYETVADLIRGLTEYFEFYNTARPHQSLDGQTPKSVYQLAA